MTVAEYEAKFATLSYYAPTLVSDDEMKCLRFRRGLHHMVATRKASYWETSYINLVDMERMIGSDVENFQKHSKRARQSESGRSGRSD